MERRTVIIPFIILLNAAVFLMWNWSFPDHSQFMEDNFAVSWSGLLQGRYWTLLTSVFSHNMLLHLFVNMLVLNSFGGVLEIILGRVRFIRFYLIAGVISSLTHALVSALILDSPGLPAVGASGAIAGLVILFSMMFPKEKILIFGLIPVPASFGALLVVGLDVWGLVAQAEGGGLPIGHGAHLGGAFAGIVYYWFFIRRNWLSLLRRRFY